MSRSRWWAALAWGLAFLLLYLAIRNIPFRLIGAALSRLTIPQLLLLILVNTVVVIVFAGRWWMVLRSLGHALPYLKVVLYRLAGFAVSYFTPGPHFGGEPLQVHLLHKREGIPVGAATASVAVEKTVELLANFSLLAIGVAVTLSMGLIPPEAAGPSAGAALTLAFIPAAYLLAARLGKRPASAALETLPWEWDRLRAAVRDIEASIVALCRRRLDGLIAALAFSLLSWIVLLCEYWVALRFLQINLSLPQIVAVVTAARLAILLPFPGGLGALEASQVIMISALGYSSAEGAAMGLLIRGRDLVFGAAGASLAWVLWSRIESFGD